MELPAKSKQVKPHQLAWLHRSELDRNNIQVWEKPDGSLFLHAGKEPLMLTITEKE